MRELGVGVTRTAYAIGPWACKVPSWRHRYLLRGWLANRSEWKQRRRDDVVAPVLTVGYLVNVSPIVLTWPRHLWGEWDEQIRPWLEFCGYSAEEAKPSSWGLFNGRWSLIDFDRCWAEPRGWVGGIYYWNQERLGRKWLKPSPLLQPRCLRNPRRN